MPLSVKQTVGLTCHMDEHNTMERVTTNKFLLSGKSAEILQREIEELESCLAQAGGKDAYSKAVQNTYRKLIQLRRESIVQLQLNRD